MLSITLFRRLESPNPHSKPGRRVFYVAMPAGLNRKKLPWSCRIASRLSRLLIELSWFEDEVGRSPSHQPGPHCLSFVHGHENGRTLVLDE
jgi:hypothetical protein